MGDSSDSDSDTYEDLYYRPPLLFSSPPAPPPGAPWPRPPSPGAAAPLSDDAFDKLRLDFMLNALLPSRPRERTPSYVETLAAENAAQRAAQQRELEERARRATADAFDGLKRYMLDTLAARVAAEARRVALVKRLQDEAMTARLASEAALNKEWEQRQSTALGALQQSFEASLRGLCEKNAAAEAERVVLQQELEAEHAAYRRQSEAAQARYSALVGQYKAELGRLDSEMQAARRDARADMQALKLSQDRRVKELQQGIQGLAKEAQESAARSVQALAATRAKMLALGERAADNDQKTRQALRVKLQELEEQHAEARRAAEQRARKEQQERDSASAQELAHQKELHELELEAAKAAAASSGAGAGHSDPYAGASASSSSGGGGALIHVNPYGGHPFGGHPFFHPPPPMFFHAPAPMMRIILTPGGPIFFP